MLILWVFSIHMFFTELFFFQLLPISIWVSGLAYIFWQRLVARASWKAGVMTPGTCRVGEQTAGNVNCTTAVWQKSFIHGVQKCWKKTHWWISNLLLQRLPPCKKIARKKHPHTTPSQNKNFVTLFPPKEIQPKRKQRINNATFEEWLKLVYPYCIAEFHLYMYKYVQIILRWLVSLEFL